LNVILHPVGRHLYAYSFALQMRANPVRSVFHCVVSEEVPPNHFFTAFSQAVVFFSRQYSMFAHRSSFRRSAAVSFVRSVDVHSDEISKVLGVQGKVHFDCPSEHVPQLCGHAKATVLCEQYP